MMKKVLFSSFSNVFHRFLPCKGMHKHAFAGRNTQHLTFTLIQFNRWQLFTCYFLGLCLSPRQTFGSLFGTPIKCLRLLDQYHTYNLKYLWLFIIFLIKTSPDKECRWIHRQQTWDSRSTDSSFVFEASYLLLISNLR